RILKERYRHPLTDKDHIPQAVVVEICKQRIAHHSDVPKSGSNLVRYIRKFDPPAFRIIPQKGTAYRSRILPRFDASRNKDVKFAVTVEIKRLHAQLAGIIVRQRVRSKREISRPVVDVQPILIIWTVRFVLISPACQINILMAVIVSIKNEYSTILTRLGGTRHLRQRFFRKPGILALEQYLGRATRVSSDTDVIKSVAIQIANRERRTVIGKLVRQGILDIEVDGLVVRMPIIYAA